MARQAIQSVNTTNEQKSEIKGKGIKSLPGVFTNDVDFRAYVVLAITLSNMDKADKYNAKLTANKLLTVKQSIANYAASGIELEQEFYPVAVNVAGLFCGINRKQRVIFAVGFIGENKFAFTVSTRAGKELPELRDKAKLVDRIGYAPKYLARLDANNGVLLPASIDFDHFVESNFGLPFCYTTSKSDLLDFGQWVGDVTAYDRYKSQAAEFENIDYYDENCVKRFVEVAENNGFAVFRQDTMKVAIDHAEYLQGVIDSDKTTPLQKVAARRRLFGDKNKTEKVEVGKTANEQSA